MARPKRTSRRTTEFEDLVVDGAPVSVEPVEPVESSDFSEPDDAPEPEPEAAPEPVKESVRLNNAVLHQQDSIRYWYRRERNREMKLTGVKPDVFMLTPSGKAGSHADDYVPAAGEITAFVAWLTTRWDGDLAYSDTAVTLTCRGFGDFHPSGGGRPRSITEL